MTSLPRTANGKFDRAQVRQELTQLFANTELQEPTVAQDLGSGMT
ncbi:MAG: hypothetical protein V9E93_03520 [Steroidobacteraceae bacterium]